MLKLTNGISEKLKAKEYNDRYRIKNKEKIKQKQLEYRTNNKEFIKERKKISYLKRREFHTPLKLLFLGARTRAGRRKQEFSITYEFFENLWETQKGKCYYTNIPMDHSYGKKNPFQMSLDRKDSTQGYTEENSILCCLSINYAKNSFTEQQLINFIKVLKQTDL